MLIYYLLFLFFTILKAGPIGIPLFTQAATSLSSSPPPKITLHLLQHGSQVHTSAQATKPSYKLSQETILRPLIPSLSVLHYPACPIWPMGSKIIEVFLYLTKETIISGKNSMRSKRPASPHQLLLYRFKSTELQIYGFSLWPT
jgi:hypothetical protein